MTLYNAASTTLTATDHSNPSASGQTTFIVNSSLAGLDHQDRGRQPERSCQHSLCDRPQGHRQGRLRQQRDLRRHRHLRSPGHRRRRDFQDELRHLQQQRRQLRRLLRRKPRRRRHRDGQHVYRQRHGRCTASPRPRPAAATPPSSFRSATCSRRRSRARTRRSSASGRTGRSRSRQPDRPRLSCPRAALCRGASPSTTTATAPPRSTVTRGSTAARATRSRSPPATGIARTRPRASPST